MVTLASEFPNDNPALHRGAIWVCHEPTACAVAERTVPLSDGLDDDGELEIVIEELEPIETRLEGVEETGAASTSESDHEHEHEHEIMGERVPPRVSEIVLVAANDRDEAEDAFELELPAVVEMADGETSVASSTVLPPPTDDPFAILVSKLVDVAIAANARDVAASLPELMESGQVAGATAWREILRGTSDDFDACGGATLDEWASDVLSRLLGTPAGMLRQELRSRGVAAFGLAA